MVDNRHHGMGQGSRIRHSLGDAQSGHFGHRSWQKQACDPRPVAISGTPPWSTPHCTAHWNRRGVAFYCFMLAATRPGTLPPIRVPRQELTPGTDRYRRGPCGDPASLSRCGGQYRRHISGQYLPACFHIFQDFLPARCLASSITFSAKPGLVSFIPFCVLLPGS
jgi:hypothetical protein